MLITGKKRPFRFVLKQEKPLNRDKKGVFHIKTVESDIGIIPDILKMLTALLVSPYIAKGIYEEMFDKRHNHNTQLKSVTELFAEIKKGLQK